MRLAGATIACLVALAACPVAGGPAAAERLPPPYSFTLVYEREGGFAPSPQGLVVAPGGFATADGTETRGGKRHAEFRLSDRRIRSLQRGLRRAHLRSIPKHGIRNCADCYVYDIYYEGSHVKLDQPEVPPRLLEVIEQIEAIISAHTIPPDA